MIKKVYDVYYPSPIDSLTTTSVTLSIADSADISTDLQTRSSLQQSEQTPTVPLDATAFRPRRRRVRSSRLRDD